MQNIWRVQKYFNIRILDIQYVDRKNLTVIYKKKIDRIQKPISYCNLIRTES